MKNKTSESTLISPIQEFLEQVHRDHAGLQDGAVATYIPELAKADPNAFGICLVTANGAVYEVGDTAQEFTIQSISKPFVYGLALEDNGRAAVLEKVGVEPTGDAFNSISLDAGTGRPRNPMINAGAIASAGLVAGKSATSRFRRILETLSLFAGRNLHLDDTVYRSESETGHRNRAIGHMLRNFDKLTGDPMVTTEIYFRQCSVAVTGRDLGVMAATLANGGVNPLTGRQALRGEYVESVLSVMGTCGMYDFAGEWLYHIGIPAKSGVAGGVLAVLPGQLGIGVYSPRLDAHGNSVRGIRVCQELSRRLDLHLFNRPALGRLSIRQRFSGADFNSTHVRRPQDEQVLGTAGKAIQIYQLQGNLGFATTEPIVRDVLARLDGVDFLVFDLRRVLSLNESAGHLLHSLLGKLAGSGRLAAFACHQHLPLLRRMMKLKLGPDFETHFHAFGELDSALEWCEDGLLEKRADTRLLGGALKPGEYTLLRGLSRTELATLIPLLRLHTVGRGREIIRAGEEAREIYFLARGVVNAYLPGDNPVRVASFSPGMCFGEMAFIDAAPRSANLVAASDVECHSLSREDFLAMGQTQPGLKIKLLEQLCLELTRKLRKANRERHVLE